MKVLVTGAAGFIGTNLCLRLLSDANILGGENFEVVGLDNINSYYDPAFKFSRLRLFGINENQVEWNKLIKSEIYSNFRFIRMNLEEFAEVEKLFVNEKFDYVIHLAAQAGIRYSIDHPRKYIQSNIDGFLNVLEGCRNNNVKHLIYASSSSVYGLNEKIPYSEKDPVSHPVSLYAATKKSNELMAHAYSHLYNLPTTGLRIFLAYGPWGRPDMAPYLFMDSIMKGKTIKVFNNGNMFRDFTYVDDIIEVIIRLLFKIPVPNSEWNVQQPDPSSSIAPYRIYNVGNSSPVKIIDFISEIEKVIGKEANKEFLPMQPGDVYQTFSDSSALSKEIGFTPNTPLRSGIEKMIIWYKEFTNLKEQR